MISTLYLRRSHMLFAKRVPQRRPVKKSASTEMVETRDKVISNTLRQYAKEAASKMRPVTSDEIKSTAELPTDARGLLASAPFDHTAPHVRSVFDPASVVSEGAQRVSSARRVGNEISRNKVTVSQPNCDSTIWRMKKDGTGDVQIVRPAR
eukprot:TRINITY_DN34625_c0_g1_i1.p1 TRINITY_DN34625_c0_g1~~TRINITY_DN34625_c0_g1_i1.p1  ORF type:complete len:151 (+),score=8.81 TRINITY_DN34625_c0_g1_i1:166-618(+)